VRALRKSLQRLWTHHDPKSCERRIEASSAPAALPLRGTMSALLCLSASSAS
jgi:hypothetical protein